MKPVLVWEIFTSLGDNDEKNEIYETPGDFQFPNLNLKENQPLSSCVFAIGSILVQYFCWIPPPPPPPPSPSWHHQPRGLVHFDSFATLPAPFALARTPAERKPL